MRASTGIVGVCRVLDKEQEKTSKDLAISLRMDYDSQEVRAIEKFNEIYFEYSPIMICTSAVKEAYLIKRVYRC